MKHQDDDKTTTHAVLTNGTLVTHYRIIEKIGAGGMGEVYLAQDTSLDRRAALKFLPAHLCEDEECRKRFKREAQAAARLDHPNIIPVYEVNEYRGRPYFVMAAIEGQSLREYVSGKELPIERILELGIQISGGLQAAHDRGIIHRDVKPSNVLIDSHGRARIVDFGLATVRGSEHLTKTGSTLGTIGYMSPEQVQGKEIDHRSDLFSLGVVLYELVAGQNPFRRDSEAATLKAVSDDAPHPLARYRSDVPDGFQNIIDKALDKDVNTRYQHADGMLSDLMRVKRSLDSGWLALSGRTRTRRGARYWLIAAALVMVAAAVVLVITKPWIADTAPVKPAKIMLAVLPFENLGAPEDEYFADGITDEITSRLATLHGLGVISRTSTLQYKGTSKNLREIGGELGVDYILEGTIRWDKSAEESRVRINPQLIGVDDDVHLWADRYDAVIDDIFAVQSSIAEEVIAALDITLLESERQVLTDQPTKNTEAYDYYLRGHEYFSNHTEKDYMNAEAMFLKAIELEPNFAKAHAWLSVVHTQIYAWYIDRTEERLAAAEEAANRSLEIVPELSEGQGALAWYHFAALNDHDLALEEFTKLREKEPNDQTIELCIAMIEETRGKWDNAMEGYRRAMKLNPRSATLCLEYGNALFYCRRYSEAETLYNRAIELRPDSRQAYVNKSVLYIFWKGDLDAARQVLQEALQRIDRWLELTITEANLEITSSNFDRALALLTELGETTDRLTYENAFYQNLKGSVYRYLNEAEPMRASYDSARIILQELILAEPEEPYNHTELGVAYAGLGRKQEAIQAGKHAVELLPVSTDAVNGADLVRNLAIIYAIAGEYDLAIEQLEYLLSIPSEVSVPWLKIWPDFAPLHDHPRFKSLLEKYSTES